MRLPEFSEKNSEKNRVDPIFPKKIELTPFLEGYDEAT